MTALATTLVAVAATRLPGADVLTTQFDVVYLLLLFVPVLPLVAVASRFPPRRSWIGLVATAAVTVAVCPDPAWSTVTYSVQAQAVAWVLGVGVPVTLALAAWLAGSALLARQQYAEALLERSASLERAHAAAAQAVAEERARIARELHDVVTHTVAVMVVQASAAGAVWDRDPEQARAALRAVEDSGRTVMSDLRGMLGAMRDARRAVAPRRAGGGGVPDTGRAGAPDRSHRGADGGGSGRGHRRGDRALPAAHRPGVGDQRASARARLVDSDQPRDCRGFGLPLGHRRRRRARRREDRHARRRGQRRTRRPRDAGAREGPRWDARLRLTPAGLALLGPGQGRARSGRGCVRCGARGRHGKLWPPPSRLDSGSRA